MSSPQNLTYLYQFCRRLEVKTVIEIGAGISTQVMRDAGVARVQTCCRSEVSLPPRPNPTCELEFFKCESTEMLLALKDAPDLFFIDGRLHPEDFAHIRRLSRPDTWYLLDDFYGLDKGVANAFWLAPGRYVLPPVGESSLAALAPLNQLAFTTYYGFSREPIFHHPV